MLIEIDGSGENSNQESAYGKPLKRRKVYRKVPMFISKRRKV